MKIPPFSGLVLDEKAILSDDPQRLKSELKRILKQIEMWQGKAALAINELDTRVEALEP